MLNAKNSQGRRYAYFAIIEESWEEVKEDILRYKRTCDAHPGSAIEYLWYPLFFTGHVACGYTILHHAMKHDAPIEMLDFIMTNLPLTSDEWSRNNFIIESPIQTVINKKRWNVLELFMRKIEYPLLIGKTINAQPGIKGQDRECSVEYNKILDRMRPIGMGEVKMHEDKKKL